MIINVVRQSITSIKDVDFICNAANGIGPMGAGIAGAIRNAGGASIQNEAFLACSKANYQPGDLYVTNAGTLPYKKVFHLVTMKYPGGKTSYDIVEKCLQSLISLCRMKKVTRVALPALGTGIGGLNCVNVAEIYKRVLNSVNDIEFVVVDIDPVFIYQFKFEEGTLK